MDNTGHNLCYAYQPGNLNRKRPANRLVLAGWLGAACVLFDLSSNRSERLQSFKAGESLSIKQIRQASENNTASLYSCGATRRY